MTNELAIIKVAEKVRQWADYINNRYCVFPVDLAGMCAICSYIIFVRLKKISFSPTLHSNDNHCFVECNGFLIDVTASQFGCDDIIVDHYEDLVGTEYFWDSQYIFTEKWDMELHFLDWGDQNPFYINELFSWRASCC